MLAGRVLELDDVDKVPPIVVVDHDRVVQSQARVPPEGHLQHSLRVGYVQEILRLRPELDEVALLQLGVLQLHDVALGEQQVLHHPVRDVAHPLLGGELEDAAVRALLLLDVGELEQHHRVVEHEVTCDVGSGRRRSAGVGARE